MSGNKTKKAPVLSRHHFLPAQSCELSNAIPPASGDTKANLNSFPVAFVPPNAASVNHAVAELHPSLTTPGLNTCPSPFLHHDSYTLPALLDCLQLLVTNSSSVDSLLSLFKLLPWFRDKSASVHSAVLEGEEGVNSQGIQRNSSSTTSLAESTNPGYGWCLTGPL